MDVETNFFSAESDARVRKGEWSRGWPTLLAAFLAMSTAWNVVSITLGVFLLPMQAEFGWSRTSMSIAPIASLLCAALLPVTGLALDRFGPRRVAMFGTVAMALTLLLFARASASLVHFGLLICLLGISGAATNSLVLARGVAGWFTRHLGAALGLLFASVSVALMIMEPLVGRIVAEDGWRRGFLLLSCTAAVLSLPALAIGFREPAAASRRQVRDGPDSFKALFAVPAFRRLAAACLIAAIPIGGAINHLVPMLVGGGVPLARASGYASLFALAIGASGIATGALFDRVSAPRVVAIVLAMSAGGNLLIASLSGSATNAHIIAAVMLGGLATGAEGNYISFFSAGLFGVRNFARVASLMALTISVGMAAGGLGFSAAFDHFGGYAFPLTAGCLLYVVAALLFLALPSPRPADADAA